MSSLYTDNIFPFSSASVNIPSLQIGAITASLEGTASYATLATSASYATTAKNISVSGAPSDTSTYVVLVPDSTLGAPQSPFIDSGLVYNANTNLLNATVTSALNGTMGNIPASSVTLRQNVVLQFIYNGVSYFVPTCTYTEPPLTD